MTIEKAIFQKKFKNEYQKLAINIFYTHSWLETIQNKLLKQYGLAVPQYNVLRILRGQSPNPCTIALITERMINKMSNASRIVDRLEKKGLVTRKPSVADRRAVDVFITEKGLNILKKLDTLQDEFEQTFQIFGEKKASELNVLLDNLRESFSQD